MRHGSVNHVKGIIDGAIRMGRLPSATKRGTISSGGEIGGRSQDETGGKAQADGTVQGGVGPRDRRVERRPD